MTATRRWLVSRRCVPGSTRPSRRRTRLFNALMEVLDAQTAFAPGESSRQFDQARRTGCAGQRRGERLAPRWHPVQSASRLLGPGEYLTAVSLTPCAESSERSLSRRPRWSSWSSRQLPLRSRLHSHYTPDSHPRICVVHMHRASPTRLEAKRQTPCVPPRYSYDPLIGRYAHPQC